MFLGRPTDFTEKILAAITVDAPASQYGWRGAVSYTHLTLPTNREV